MDSFFAKLLSGKGALNKEEIREVFVMSFELYKMAEHSRTLYRKDQNADLTKRLIELYYKQIKPDYSSMIYLFKKKYIHNESLVEKNDTKEERHGLGLVYDYIQDFNPEKDDFNIFINSMIIHQLLYKPLDDKRNEDNNSLYLNTLKELDIAKNEKNLKKYKECKEKLKTLSQTSSKFGGQLRKEKVNLLNTDIKVPTSEDAIAYFNSFLTKERKMEYENILCSVDIFEYINYCVKVTVDLIKTQPFQDGNKRTFRSLLNLMFKKRNLPPVYITVNERKRYKEAIIKAMKYNDYTDIIHFYYYKICDSIYELDIKPTIEEKIKNEKKLIKQKKDAI